MTDRSPVHTPVTGRASPGWTRGGAPVVTQLVQYDQARHALHPLDGRSHHQIALVPPPAGRDF
jgi:hypothetical protein